MPRYPLIDTRGLVVGSIILNDDVIPEAMMDGIDFALGGSWVEGYNDFRAFLLVPMEDLKMELEKERDEPQPPTWLEQRRRRRHG